MLCPTCHRAGEMVRAYEDYDKYLFGCDQGHTWDVSGIEIVKAEKPKLVER